MARTAAKIKKVAKRIRKSTATVSARRVIRKDSSFRPTGRVDVLVNFPDGKMNLYQIRQWYGPLESLAQTRKVAILCYRPETARQIAMETSLAVYLTPSFTDLSEVTDILDPGVILYPNQNYSNYRILAHNRAQHVFICHGESDKIYMASNWVKAFNYFFVAGEASRDRLRAHVRNYEVEQRTIPIGRPQIDVPHDAPIAPVPGRTTVLYAPTWEGGRATMRYGSVASHGKGILRALLASDEFQVIYRPHPRTGVQLKRTKAANRRLKRLVSQAAKRDSSAGHIVDTTPFGWQLDYADFMITDISAVAYDWLSTGKPLLVTKPTEPQTPLAESGYMAAAPLLDARDFQTEEDLAQEASLTESVDVAADDLDDEGSAEASSTDGRTSYDDDESYGNEGEDDLVGVDETPINTYVASVVRRMLHDPEARDTQESWAEYYYGDRTPGSSMSRWIAAIEHVLAERDKDIDNIRPTKLGTSLPRSEKLAHYASTIEMIAVNQLSPHKEAAVARTKDAIATGRTAEVVVPCMAPPHETDALRDWLPALELLDRTTSVAITVSDIRTYRLLSARTGLRVFLTKNAVASEQLTDTLHPSLGLHFDQSKLNLRETTYRYMTHAYVGNHNTNNWVNNRLRLFDVVLSPSSDATARVKQSIMNIPSTVALDTFEDTGRAADRVLALEKLVRESRQ